MSKLLKNIINTIVSEFNFLYFKQNTVTFQPVQLYLHNNLLIKSSPQAINTDYLIWIYLNLKTGK